MIKEGFLQRMQAVALRYSFNSRDRGPVGENRKRQAGGDGAAVELHRAGTADAEPAALLSTGQLEVFAQEIHQQPMIRNFPDNLLAIHGYADRLHGSLALARSAV